MISMINNNGVYYEGKISNAVRENSQTRVSKKASGSEEK